MLLDHVDVAVTAQVRDVMSRMCDTRMCMTLGNETLKKLMTYSGYGFKSSELFAIPFGD